MLYSVLCFWCKVIGSNCILDTTGCLCFKVLLVFGDKVLKSTQVATNEVEISGVLNRFVLNQFFKILCISKVSITLNKFWNGINLIRLLAAEHFVVAQFSTCCEDR